MQKSSVLVLLVALAVPGVVSAHPTWLDACEQAVLDYAYYRDRPDADNVAKLFTSDGTFKMAQDVFSGRDAIHQRIKDAEGGPVFRHMMSTIHIEQSGEDTARGVSYATVYLAPPGELPITITDFAALGEYHDEFVRQGEGCLIRNREFIQVFVPG